MRKIGENGSEDKNCIKMNTREDSNESNGRTVHWKESYL